ncbi:MULTISPECIES: thiamine pyrophosphate-binding protein [Pseudomonas]|uniref:Thiamine pyrophosphate-binding protein n=1 Tax=Pseudomonas peradeniyensis TaxID=2745488 RepID=A0ABT2VDE1_9PSED|nr:MULTISPECIES: thiamine pyrophosphate-binding protein [Pseudomonas]MCU7239308.1 thiamine pyrophosphate-binding protein [Pseudomonas peradeniyensis]MCU7281548.1 thiamine pyrophosphate-binding protein [Pseudomonas peradeniyensis]QZA55892.1 thiamine pyrophosphate-binding protein [Pseudomonas sp. 2hn]
MRVADYIMNRLAELGIKQVFFLPGGGAMHLNDALGRHPDLEPVLCLHEQACGVAAEAAGKLSGGPSACMTTCGPGATNAVTATLGAWLDSTPVFFISGQVKTADLKADSGLRMLGVQEVDIVSIVSSITKRAVTLTDPEAVAEVFDELEHAALTGRRGPVWLDVPLDVQAVQIDPSTLRRAQLPTPAKSVELAGPVARTLELLKGAKRPGIIAGSGIRMAGAVEAFRQLAQSAGVPVMPTWLAMDLIEDEHPLYGGRPGSIAPRWANFTLQNCDLLIVLGSRLDMALTAYNHAHFAPKAKKVVVDIDPAEIAKLQMEIELPVVSDVKPFIEQLQAAIDVECLPDFAAWREQIASWRARYPLLQPEHADDSQGVSMYHFSDRLSDLLKEGDVIAPGSSGFASELFLLNLRLKKHQRCFHNRGTGSMGFGVPAAIGACLAAGRKQTICVDGDGGVQMNIQELATLAAQKLPIKVFVINNQGYASIRTSQSAHFKLLVGADASSGLQLPDLQQLTAAYGVGYSRIDSHMALDEKLMEVLDRDGPVVCEVVVQVEEARVPRVMTRINEQGKPETGALEDLYPFLPRDEFAAQMAVSERD